MPFSIFCDLKQIGFLHRLCLDRSRIGFVHRWCLYFKLIQKVSSVNVWSLILFCLFVSLFMTLCSLVAFLFVLWSNLNRFLHRFCLDPTQIGFVHRLMITWTGRGGVKHQPADPPLTCRRRNKWLVNGGTHLTPAWLPLRTTYRRFCTGIFRPPPKKITGEWRVQVL